MLIGQLAERTGSSRRSLRYYEEQGLIAASRDRNGYRSYPAGTEQSVRRIRVLLGAGIPVRVIRDVLDCVCGGDAEIEPCMEPALREELRRADERIDEHLARRDELRKVLEAF
ncbi:MerR family transcriptional regulator [Microbacterium marinilacus]|nr:MerR family transcriptional regulator [Microbacterium marinilacus]MBY0687452.1 MerR family transcriptional regulator [Microbacterium marinilacus]